MQPGEVLVLTKPGPGRTKQEQTTLLAQNLRVMVLRKPGLAPRRRQLGQS